MMRNNLIPKLFTLVILTGVILFPACDTSDDPDPNNGNALDSATFRTNAEPYLALQESLGALQTEMKKGDGTNNGTVDSTTLQNIFEQGSPSIQQATTSFYSGLLEEWFGEIAKASTSDLELTVDGYGQGEGGTIGDHLLNEYGVEYEQLIEKGLYGAAHYNHTVNTLFTGDITVEKLHQAVALYGTNIAFDLEANIYSAHYADDHPTENNTFHSQLQGHFESALQTAQEEGSLSADAQVATDIKNTWEKSMAARAIHYINSGQTGIRDAEDQVALGNALHGLAEGIGLMYGLYQVGGKMISDAQIESVLENVNLAVETEGTFIDFIDAETQDSALADMDNARSTLVDVYGFDSEAAANW